MNIVKIINYHVFKKIYSINIITIEEYWQRLLVLTRMFLIRWKKLKP